MKTIYASICMFICSYLYTQEINTDILKAPASPASNLLGVASSEINKPTDVASFMFGLQNFSFNFIEKGSFAIDISPYWIFPGKKEDKTVEQMLFDSKKTLSQTFVLSFAVKNVDSIDTHLPNNSIYTGIGFKFSLFRGNADDETQVKYMVLKELLSKNAVYISQLDVISLEKKDTVLTRSIEKRNALLSKANDDPAILYMIKQSKECIELDTLISNRKKIIMNVAMSADKMIQENELKIKSNQQTFTIERTGFLWDFAGGTSLQFKEKRFNNSKIYNAGLWTVLGYATKDAGTPLFLLRYMYNPKSDWMTTEDFKPDGNFSTFDAGLKYEYSPKDSKFTGSFEGLYRSFISGSDLKPTWKCVLNLDYAIFPNQHLTLSLGKDFDNNIIKNGNVIAGLSFLSGIGTKRKIQ